MRLLLYGEEAEDFFVQSYSFSTEEYASPLIDIPTGIPLDDSDGFWQTCKSIYVCRFNNTAIKKRNVVAKAVTRLTAWKIRFE